MRNSRQKLIVRQSVMHRFDHPTAMDVYAAARELDPHISLGTVYRNLNELVELGEVRKLTMPDKSDRFDATTYEHHHVLCAECHAVFDIDMTLTRRLSEKIKCDTGVALDRLQLVGTGVCEHCLKNLRKQDLKKEELCQS